MGSGAIFLGVGVRLRTIKHSGCGGNRISVAKQLAANEKNTPQTSEEFLLSTIDGLQDDKLTGFARRLALTAHTAIPRESEIDFLAALLH
jgi:hypothetical protein